MGTMYILVTHTPLVTHTAFNDGVAEKVSL